MKQPKSKYSLPTKTEVIEEETIDPSEGLDIGLFALIKSQIPNYPNMLALSLEPRFWNIAYIMTGNGLNEMRKALESDTALLYECYSFMDVLNMLELLHFNNRPNSIIGSMTLTIIKSRSNSINNKEVSTEAVVNESTGFSFVKEEFEEEETSSFKDFLLNNQVIVAFYLYRLVVRFFGIDHNEKEKRQLLNR